MQVDIVREQWRAPQRSSETIGDYVEHWIEQRQLKRTTRAGYQDLLRLHIRPTIGKMHVTDVRPLHVRTWHADLLVALCRDLAAKRDRQIAAGSAPSAATSRTGRPTAAAAYRLLRAAMNTAVEDELITRNPCRVTGASRVEPVERPIASVDEVLALASAAPARYRALILLASFVGLRIGELAALRRREVHDGQLHVAERVYRLAGGELDFDRPKSRAGVRNVHLGDTLEAELRAHTARWVPLNLSTALENWTVSAVKSEHSTIEE